MLTGPVGRQTLVADARYVVDATRRGAEFALMVAGAWQRRGIGERAVAALQRAAAAAGLRWLYGSVLADNAPMLALMRHCGFLCTRSRVDRDLVSVEAGMDPHQRFSAPPLAARCSRRPVHPHRLARLRKSAMHIIRPSQRTPSTPRLALVLGSGGVRSVAAIGIVECLAREGIRPDLVVGCSSGALFGATIALGWPATRRWPWPPRSGRPS